jgi:uncharacterized protein
LPQRHLVVFAKAPVLGRVKTRLARDIGALAALRFHRLTTAALLRRVAGDPRWRCWLALSPDRAASGPRYWPSPATRLPQGSGDLGARMRRPFLALPPGPVVIIGSDIPGIVPGHLVAAFRALDKSHLVFGPATDGGYWLVGARRPLPARLFAGVRWSSEHALADTLAGIPSRFRVSLVDTLDDVDDGAAWRGHRAARSGRGASSAGIDDVKGDDERQRRQEDRHKGRGKEPEMDARRAMATALVAGHEDKNSG